MNSKEYVQITLSAIESVKGRAKAAMEAGDLVAFSRLMGDLSALECCLRGEVEQLLVDLEKAAS